MQFFSNHQTQIIALLVAVFCVSFAKKIIPFVRGSKKDRGKAASRWAAFGAYVIGGAALAVALTPIVFKITKLGSLGGLASVLGNIGAIVALALGWQGVAMGVSVTRDLFDKVPDHEARTGALWMPTLLPIGGTAVAGIVSNPQSLGQGVTAALMGAITLAYVFMITKRMDAAVGHKNVWNWLAFATHVLGGLVLVPLIAYTDTAILSNLPAPFSLIFRIGIGLSGLAAVGAGVFDIYCDGEPNKLARIGATYGLGVTFIFGGLAWVALTGAATTGAGFLDGVF